MTFVSPYLNDTAHIKTYRTPPPGSVVVVVRIAVAKVVVLLGARHFELMKPCQQQSVRPLTGTMVLKVEDLVGDTAAAAQRCACGIECVDFVLVGGEIVS